MLRPSKPTPSHRFRRALGAAVVVGGSALVNSACDSTARIFLRLVQFDHLEVIGATPVKAVTLSNGTRSWAPACDGDATNVRIDFNLINTGFTPDEDGLADEDREIRPNEDAIGKRAVVIGKTISVDSFDLKLTCLEEHKGTVTSSNCATAPAVTVESNGGLQFVDHLRGEGRRTPMGVAVLIDQSGSTSGNVAGDKLAGATRPVCIEGKSGSMDTPADFAECASDKGNTRLAQAKDFIQKLNAWDRKIVFQFSEKEDWKIVCETGVASADESFKAANCYSENDVYSIGQSPLNGQTLVLSPIDGPNGLQGKGSGRSNLWSAMDKTFEYMKVKGEVAKHLVVFTDGPDTCASRSDDYQHCFTYPDGELPAAQAPCASAVDFNNFRTKIEDYLAARATQLAENDIHVSFIHFQAPGYPEYDSRMQQIACMTGGQYVFLNTNQLDDAGRSAAFSAAVSKVRYSMGGHWSLITGIGEFTADPATSSAAAAPGVSYALSGNLSFKAGSITPVDKIVPFSLGSTTAGDERLAILRPCMDDADCGVGAGAECGVRCDLETRLCQKPAQGLPCSTGVCCGGVCSPGTLTADGDAVCVDAADFASCP